MPGYWGPILSGPLVPVRPPSPEISQERATRERCWADEYRPGGDKMGEACQRVIDDCRIGLCAECCQSLCSRESAA